MKDFWKKYKREATGMLTGLFCLAVVAVMYPLEHGKGNLIQGEVQQADTVVKEEISAENAVPSETERPKIALTFDDGPSGEWTPLLLDGLKERGVKATFFLIGRNVQEYPDLVKRLAEEGHLIGNHTYNHVEISSLPADQVYREITDTSELIASITGSGTEYLRPPFGVWTEELEAQYEVMPVMWSVDPLDWTTENTDEIVDKVVTETEENDIILLHDCYESSVKAALRIVDILEGQGFEFVTVDELLVD